MGQQNHLARGDYRLHYEIGGTEGKPWLTFLHALATSTALWEPQAEAFAGDYRILRIDFRGHGGSTVGAAPYAIPDLADDVAAVWDAAGLERSSVVGLSLGGMTALALGLDHADRVDRIVAADCRADAPEFFRNMWDARRQLLAVAGISGVAEATLPTWLTTGTREQDPDLTRRVRRMIEATDMDGYRAATVALQGLDLKPRLPQMRRPTLYLCGAEDGAHPAAMRDMAEATPGSTYVEIADAAHISNLERPAAFNDAVRGFLSA